MRQEGLVVDAGTGVYAVHETGGTSRASSLRLWATGSIDEPTALESLYLDVDDPPGPHELDSDVDAPFQLTRSRKKPSPEAALLEASALRAVCTPTALRHTDRGTSTSSAGGGS